ncbi:family 16 glycosylhydrolase [Spectribacter hydrogenooxidans]|uniref:Beta-glucanase n=1 Tax=Spectribacter hydrogenoxidans TaxID=3075608 RepID=A0ABU3C484_9GAMM|nr:family 16 glycosylhydrolase [Salinisphaera sp. W335]MDT0636373.1 family 16 glycosylhydrolase [Salinisphaera sp. W335]
MNIQDASNVIRKLSFYFRHVVTALSPRRQISSLGVGGERIGAIIVINLDRQPGRWRQMRRELSRFRTANGTPLTSIAHRLTAIDARDGCAVAATSDVDPCYRVGDQLYVQPDGKLAACFDADEPVRMTRQEVAVARSHIEVWKAIANGSYKYVLVLEDDVWFKGGAATAIDRGWRAALRHRGLPGGPRLLYVSYSDADGTAERIVLGDDLFRPVRGLWFLSGYVLSREGAETLLKAMPVNGPVDLWMNSRFEALNALALASPAVLQRQDVGSDNVYSILPFLARAGTINASSASLPADKTHAGPILGWTRGGAHDDLAMALSMLGLRVRVFDGYDPPVHARKLVQMFETFDAIVDPPTPLSEINKVFAKLDTKYIFEEGALREIRQPISQRSSQAVVLRSYDGDDARWKPLCALLDLPEPAQPFPSGPPRVHRVFRVGRPETWGTMVPGGLQRPAAPLDESPWILPTASAWQPVLSDRPLLIPAVTSILQASMRDFPSAFRTLTETFPGNMAAFATEGLVHGETFVGLTLTNDTTHGRPYRSGAFASVAQFAYGRFEAEIKAAAAPGLITGFFLHRDTPRQEIDIEFIGDDPTSMLANVYFNPGDAGSTMAFGYRGSPCRIDLGFDATLDFHHYAIEWRPEGITWRVDGRIVHTRTGWDPTPIPHLPMRLHGNLWAPRSRELAGCITDRHLPATATFRHVSIWTWDEDTPSQKADPRSVGSTKLAR